MGIEMLQNANSALHYLENDVTEHGSWGKFSAFQGGRFQLIKSIARTCYFAILERTWGGGGGCHPPRAVSPLLVLELRDKNQRILWDVANPTVPDFTPLGHTLTFPGQVKLKKIAIYGCFVLFCFS